MITIKKNTLVSREAMMANVRFLQSVLAGLVAATMLAAGMTGALLVRASISGEIQFAAHQAVEPEALK
jgi:hypothetical protein